MNRAVSGNGIVSGQKVIADIARYGWHCVTVLEDADGGAIAAEALAGNEGDGPSRAGDDPYGAMSEATGGLSETAGALSFAYTVGLYHTYRHPELIVFGLPSLKAHLMLQRAVGAITGDPPLDLSAPNRSLLAGASCRFIETELAEDDRRLAVGRWYYAGNGFPLQQIVWSSADGYFPWQSRAPRDFKAVQPVLARSRALALARAESPARRGRRLSHAHLNDGPPLRRRTWPSNIVSRLKHYFVA